jgi:hypothetical protein
MPAARISAISSRRSAVVMRWGCTGFDIGASGNGWIAAHPLHTPDGDGLSGCKSVIDAILFKDDNLYKLKSWHP